MGGKRTEVAQFLAGRHALIPWPRQEDLGIALEVCRSVMLDNGAFSAWMAGEPIRDWSGYYAWCKSLCRHPAYDFAVIPDVIDGTESDNDALLAEWPKAVRAAPVYHYHESLERAERLANEYPLVCLGSSGQWPTPGTPSWWRRTDEIMAVMCDSDGRPKCQLHGLRMLSPAIFTRLPLRSADSTNAAQNSGLTKRFGMYSPPTSGQRATVIAQRIESHQSAAVWVPSEQGEDLFILKEGFGA